MNDDELTQLASSYLDEEATPDERAQVEASEQLLDAVDRLRAARLVLGAVEPAPISTREAQLAAALGAWDRLPDAERTGALRDVTPVGVDAAAAAGAAALTAPPRRRSDRRRTPSTKWLTAAAACLVVVLAGGVALQLGGGNDDDSDASSELTADDAADAAASELAESAEAGGDSATEATLSALDDDSFAAEELEATAAADGGELDTGIDDAAPPGDDDLIVLLTTADLALFASDAIGAPTAPDGPAATSAPIDLGDLTEEERALIEAEFPKCLGVDLVVGPAIYGEIEVVVGIDEGRDLAIAYLVADCVEIARARLG